MDPRFSGSHQDTTLHDPSLRPALGPTDQLREIPAKTPGWVGALLAGILGPSVGGGTAMAMNALIAQRAFATSGPGLFLTLVASEFGIALAAIVPAALSPLPWRVRLGLVRPRWTLAQALLLVGATLGVVMASRLDVELLHRASLLPAISEWRSDFTRQLLGVPMRWLVPVILAASVLAGTCEELLYRGFVQGGLIRRWKPWVAIAVASALFAAAHEDVVYMAFSFPVGLWLGFVAWRSGSVIPGILCHASLNAIRLVWGRVARSQNWHQAGPSTPSEIAITVAVLVLVFLPITVLAVRALRRIPPATAESVPGALADESSLVRVKVDAAPGYAEP